MIATRSKKANIMYKKYRASHNKICVFCFDPPKDSKIIGQTKYFFIVTNIFPYKSWDGQTVLKHLLLTPRAHIMSTAEFSPEMMQDYSQHLAKYESSGYNIYTRGQNSAAKSMPHHHTHLIKTDNRPPRMLFFLRKPRIWVKF